MSSYLFFEFGARENHDLDKIAQKLVFEDKLNYIDMDSNLRVEYSRKDRYWRTIYASYDLFKSQYNACVERLLALKRHDRGEREPYWPVTKTSDVIELPVGPSEEIKNQVKVRDHYRCLCCGENGRQFLDIDRIVPGYYGNTNPLDNFQTLCFTCKEAKGSENFINFRVHQTDLSLPPSQIPQLEIFSEEPREVEKYFYRTLNFFYRCAAVSKVKKRKLSYFAAEEKQEYLLYYSYDIDIDLNVGNNPLWLKSYFTDWVVTLFKQRLIESVKVSVPGGVLISLTGPEIESIIHKSEEKQAKKPRWADLS